MESFAILNVSGSAADIILIFAKDKNGIYYQGDFIKIDTTGFRVVGFISHYYKPSDYWEEPIWRTHKQAFRGKKQINISDPATFESVSTCYFKDKNYLYYYDQKVEGADVATLQKERAEGKFVSDKNNTYYQGKPFIYKGSGYSRYRILYTKPLPMYCAIMEEMMMRKRRRIICRTP